MFECHFEHLDHLTSTLPPLEKVKILKKMITLKDFYASFTPN